MNWLRLPGAPARPLPIPLLNDEERRAPWELDAFRTDVMAGLSRLQKTLPPKYFYDAAGSALFDQITRLPEYYLTRAEQSILAGRAAGIAQRIGAGALLVELGSGNSRKAELLLEHMEDPAGYVPVKGDFTLSFALPPAAARALRTAVFFPGSTIGNLEPHEAVLLMRKIHRRVAPGGMFVVGVDTRKDTQTLERAYNDAQGVTAAFNRNLLVRLARQLRTDLDPDSFEHLAVFNPVQGRIEMHLRSRLEQRVRIEDRGFRFRRGETIVTEYSYKYTPEEFLALAQRAGFHPLDHWQDEAGAFSVHCLTP